ncbi:hypothetical protein ES319_A10G194000v1 [Gossypium barbadense]|uniref:Uncharacterized protein n=2 Tax=Gossypium TaxID=3633 RepID=A0A5J5U8Z9_GOSBA|nr:hypothetical protein ES319_A10G194000v1 [Gossypium barbadense]TYG99707.1 hypothetical protein ES288_A10G217000v1 [Gossypium darwinii]
MDRTFHLSSMEQTFQPPSQKLPLGHHSYCDLSKKKGKDFLVNHICHRNPGNPGKWIQVRTTLRKGFDKLKSTING